MLTGMIDTISEYIIVGLIISSALYLLYLIVYFFVYKKLLHGKKTLNLRKALIINIFTVYIFLVLYATMFARFSGITGGINLELFNSYKKALFKLSSSAWRDITLNIFMFVPFGFLLPLLSKFFYKPYFTVILSFLFTLSIETVQLIIKIGAFDLDDIFNNVLGAIMGYCLVMSLLSSGFNKEKNKTKYSFIYTVPLIIITLVFLGFYIFCNFK